MRPFELPFGDADISWETGNALESADTRIRLFSTAQQEFFGSKLVHPRTMLPHGQCDLLSSLNSEFKDSEEVY
jgi:hypothetical protein